MGDFGVVLDFRLLTYLKYAPHQKNFARLKIPPFMEFWGRHKNIK